MDVCSANHAVDGLLAFPENRRGLRWTDAVFKMSAVGSRFGEPAWEDGKCIFEKSRSRQYIDIGCANRSVAVGELLSTGESITRLTTSWKHRCGKCGHEDWADATYPRVAYLPIDAIGPDDSYT